MPLSNSPVTSVTSPDITCNVNPTPATETVQVAAGATIGFKLDNTLYHPGPAAIYLGKAPSTAANWDGSGANWFKIAEWGAAFNPFTFTDENASQLTTTIPANTPAGEVSLQKLSHELHERSEFFSSTLSVLSKSHYTWLVLPSGISLAHRFVLLAVEVEIRPKFLFRDMFSLMIPVLLSIFIILRRLLTL